MKLLLFFFLLLIFSGTSIPAQQQPASAENKTSPRKGPPDLKDIDAYEFFLLNEKNKLQVSNLSQVNRKNQILIVDFWATWCGPCRMAIPALVELQEKYRDKGVEVIGLTVEDPELKDQILDFKKEFRINYRLGFAGKEIFLAFDQTGVLPQTFIFSREGILLKHIRGYHPTKVPPIIQETIDKELSDKSQNHS